MFYKQGVQFPGLNRAWNQLIAIIESDLRKLRHDPVELFTRMIQPIVWLLIFGQAMNRIGAIPTGGIPYLDFVAPGILIQGILFMSIFYGISLIWERDSGTLHKILITPAPRTFLVLGRALACGIRGLFQVATVYFLSILVVIHLNWNPLALLGVLVMSMLAGALFCTLSFLLALLVKKRERFIGIGQVLTMPLFFASNALYPIQIMPFWIQVFSRINPITYQVDALRALMIEGQESHFGLFFDFGINFIIFALLLTLASRHISKLIH